MSEVGASGAEVDSRTGLFLIDGGVDPEVTSLFLRADPASRIILAGTVDIFRRVAEKHEQAHGSSPKPGFLATKAGSKAIKEFPGFARDVEWPYIRFRSGLATHTGSNELRQIETEFYSILTGKIQLTDAQKQQLSNLSDSGLEAYLDAFGIKQEELAFPLLDVGTGLNARFAQDVLAEYPDQRVVSTSMHLLSPSSIMAKRLAKIEPARRGELVACGGLEMPFDDNSFSMVVSCNADPYYVPRKDLLTSLREKHRVMKVGATAILCPSVCQYGEHDITPKDIAALPSEIDVTIEPIPDSGKHTYNGDIRNLLVINK